MASQLLPPLQQQSLLSGPLEEETKARGGATCPESGSQFRRAGPGPELSDPEASAPHTALWSLRKMTRDCQVSPTRARFSSSPHSSREQHVIQVGPRMARRTRYSAEKSEGRSREGRWVYRARMLCLPFPLDTALSQKPYLHLHHNTVFACRGV